MGDPKLPFTKSSTNGVDLTPEVLILPLQDSKYRGIKAKLETQLI